MKIYILWISLILLIAPIGYGQTAPTDKRLSTFSLNACHGVRKPLTISSQMPYVIATLGKAQGYFLVDFGTTTSSIDPSGFLNKEVPQPSLGTANAYTGFDFYGDWGTVRFLLNNYSGIRGTVRQAGIIGTDFLAVNVFTVDYKQGNLYRANSGSFCKDDVLRSEGFVPVSARGFYENDLRQVKAGFPRIPTVPIRIGKVTAIAQLDTGYDDSPLRHSVNVNRAFFKDLIDAGVKLEKIQQGEIWLSTCVANLNERVTPYRIVSGEAFEIIGINGSAALAVKDAIILLKETPKEAKSCGGIGTWDISAAQVSASFFIDSGQIVFDPFSARVWFGRVID